MTNQHLPTINPKQTEILTAPLVHLVEVDPSTLNQKELENYLKNIRELRGNSATVRAKTERQKRDGQMKNNLSSLL